MTKTLRQAEKVSQVGSGKSSNSLLYSKIKKNEHVLYKTKARLTKRRNEFKGFGRSNNAEIWIFFNDKLQLKDT